LTAASAPSSSAAAPKADNVIVTKEQIAATNTTTPQVALNVTEHNPDAQLAIALGHEMRDEVEKHTTKFSRTLSSTVINTHRLLELIRESMPVIDAKDSPADQLWIELEQLFTAASDAKDALPKYLEQQRNNMTLFHHSMENERIRDAQEELNLSHKKVSSLDIQTQCNIY
jgi:hypothetical protein